MDKKKKYVLKGMFIKFEQNSGGGRIYPSEMLKKAIDDYRRNPNESLEDAAERYKNTIAGGTGALIEHYENYYEKWHHTPTMSAHYLLKAIKLRIIKLNKEYCE